MLQSTKISEVLDAKGRDLFWLPPNASVYEAVELMASKGIGSLLVLEEGRMVGIITERDYARKVVLKGRNSKATPVCEIMTSPVTFITPDCTVEEAMSLMTERRIRHLPVMTNDQLAGVISIGDVVKSIIRDQAATIGHLHAYITGRYPG